MKRMTKIGIYGMAVWMLSACGNGTPDYDATGTFEATEVIVSAEAAGKLLQLEVEEGTRLKAGEEVGLVDTVQLYLKKLQLEANMKSVESQRPDLAKQIAATKQQITTAQREKKRVENLLAAGAANQKLASAAVDCSGILIDEEYEQSDGTGKFGRYTSGTGGRPVEQVPYSVTY